MIKQQIGKLNIDETSAQELQQICEGFGIEILQTEIDDIDLVRKLPIIKGHGDPFDRLIICQAQNYRLPVITSDRKFRLYSIDVVW
jgi:PIN domain nuclease of toxin-antitoxin system